MAFSADSTLFSGMAYLGTIIGQLSFGYFVDRYGRKYGELAWTRAQNVQNLTPGLFTGMLAASTIMIVGSALCAGAYGAGGSTEGMFTALIVYRLVTGIGSEFSAFIFCVQSFERSHSATQSAPSIRPVQLPAVRARRTLA